METLTREDLLKYGGAALAAGAGLTGAAAGTASAAPSKAPGAPGRKERWLPADKKGFGTSTTTASKVWYTLEDGRLSEVYYPDLSTPSVRELQFIVSDGRTFSELESEATRHETRLADRRALVYRQKNTAMSGRYRLTKTYITDPERSALLIRVDFESLDGGGYDLYVLYDPALDNGDAGDSARSRKEALLSWDGRVASTLLCSSGFAKTSSGYSGRSDGWTDLKRDNRMDWTYSSAPDGHVVQTAQIKAGRRHTRFTLSLGFGRTRHEALRNARASLRRPFGEVKARYRRGWREYLRSLRPAPRSVSGGKLGELYTASVMVLKAHEDKTYPGAFVASPTMPWEWGGEVTDLSLPSGPYHLVWSRDLYEIATALIAAGDRAAARRALRFLFERQQKPDGSFPQNSKVDGTPYWTGLQLDEVSDPIILAWQLRERGADTWRHVRAAADFIVKNGPQTEQERWENQSGYSPATIAAEVAGLVCAADIARANGDGTRARRYLKTADEWQRRVEDWTVTNTGPYGNGTYYLRLTKDGNPNSGTTYAVGDGDFKQRDQRTIVDPSFLELVRLGVKPARDRYIRESLPVIDRQLAVDTPNGRFWHRYSFDGYGEQPDGEEWVVSTPQNPVHTIGRVWPIFAGERGEYLLAANEPGAKDHLEAMAGAANEGLLMPEQVWDEHPPSGRPGFPRGEGTFSATPLAWTHAQFVRLARSIDAGRPVETPEVVARRYSG